MTCWGHQISPANHQSRKVEFTNRIITNQIVNTHSQFWSLSSKSKPYLGPYLIAKFMPKLDLIWPSIERHGLMKLSQWSVLAGYLSVHTYYFYLFAISEVFPHSLTSEQRALSLKMPHSDSLPPPHYNLTLIMDSRPQTSWSILSQGGGTLACPSIMAF